MAADLSSVAGHSETSARGALPYMAPMRLGRTDWYAPWRHRENDVHRATLVSFYCWCLGCRMPLPGARDLASSSPFRSPCPLPLKDCARSLYVSGGPSRPVADSLARWIPQWDISALQCCSTVTLSHLANAGGRAGPFSVVTGNC